MWCRSHFLHGNIKQICFKDLAAAFGRQDAHITVPMCRCSLQIERFRLI